jgi:glucosylceramidase
MFISSSKDSLWQILENGGKTDGIPVQFGEEKQKIRGFGGCFNELGAIALEKLDENERERAFDALFGDGGCAFDFCRLSIGANDFAETWYSYNETGGDYEMKNFSIDYDRKRIIPYIKEGLKRKPGMEFFASPWSPPSWMKFPKSYNYGTLVQTRENLAAYALYFRKYLEAYKAEGINVSQIHVQNEPASSQKFPSCIWTGEEFRKFIAEYLGDELNGLADIWLGTINGPEIDQRALYTRYNDYAGYVLKDKKCRELIKGVSYQWAGKFAVQQTRDDYPDLELIQSESECGGGDNSWEYAMYIFEMARHYFRNGVSAYVYWNMALPAAQESTWGWKQNSLITSNAGKAVYNPEFYLMKHLSRFVKKGARYLSVKGPWSSNTIAFKNPDGQVVTVTANPYNNAETIVIGPNSYELPPMSFNTII